MLEGHDFSIENHFVNKAVGSLHNLIELPGDPTQIAREKFHPCRSAMQLRADAVKLVFHVDHLFVRAARSRGILRGTAASRGFALDNHFVSELFADAPPNA